MTGSPITKLMISLSDVDAINQIDEKRSWQPIMSGEDYDESQAVFIGFYAGESPAVDGEIEYDDFGDEVFWVYKTDYTIGDLLNDEVTPQELFKELEEEQPNIEVAGLCRYVRNIPPE